MKNEPQYMLIVCLIFCWFWALICL